ncbi:hypothetical protein Tco_0865132 [Tanacetum coccineum]
MLSSPLPSVLSLERGGSLDYASFNESEINALKIQIERLKKEKESNQFKIDNFENASKSLFAPPIIDLANSGLEEFKQPEFEEYGVKVNKSVSENSSNEIKKTSGAPIIEDWVSDYDEDETLEKVSNFAPIAVLTKSGLVPISTARQSSSIAAAIVSTVKYIKTAALKPFVNSVNTAKGKRVTSDVGEQGINTVKSKACWVWRPKLKFTTQQMVINSPCLPDKKELAIPGQTTTGKEFSNPLMAGSLPKTILPPKLLE